VLLDPRELSEVHHQRPFGGGLGSEVEVLQRLVRRKPSRAGALPRAGRFAGEHLGLTQRLEELLIRPLLLAGLPGGLSEPLSDPRRLERRQ
jgi:hypothetical protein